MSSPSMVHEGVIALVRDNPAFAASVLRDLLHVDVPHFHAARLTEAEFPQLVPVEYHADAVVLFDGVVDDETKPVLGRSSRSSSSARIASATRGRSMQLPPVRATSVRSS